MRRLYLLFCIVLILQWNFIDATPFVTRTNKGVDIDIWPFFKMHLAREPVNALQKQLELNIEVLSGMVKVNVLRPPGEKAKVNVEVFGLGGGKLDQPKHNDDDDFEPEDDLDTGEDQIENQKIKDSKDNNL